MEIIAGARSYLEVGARHGDTFFEVMKSLPVGSFGVAVDLPGGLWGSDSKRNLLKVGQELNELGYEVDVIFSSSHDVTFDRVFDAVLIDADHRYESVKKDFELHGHHKIVAFHDIACEGVFLREHEVGVPKLWNEIKHNYRHQEIIEQDDHRPMGIGVIWTE